MSSDIERWWSSLPILTKYLFVGSFGLTLAANFGLINPMLLILDWHAIFTQFQVWRLVTCFLFHGRLGFPFLIHMMFLVRYAGNLESEVFNGRLSDYLYMQMITCGLLLVYGYFFHVPILGMGLIMSLIYYWSRKNPEVEMSFLFGIRFKAIYFPWVLVAFNLLLGGFPLTEVAGIIAGHFYFFFEDIYYRTTGFRLLKTPQWLYAIIPPEYNSFARQQVQMPQASRRTAFTGTGYTLGGN
jgi:derlin-1